MTNLAKNAVNVGMGLLGVVIGVGLLLQASGVEPSTVNTLTAKAGELAMVVIVVGLIAAILLETLPSEL